MTADAFRLLAVLLRRRVNRAVAGRKVLTKEEAGHLEEIQAVRAAWCSPEYFISKCTSNINIIISTINVV